MMQSDKVCIELAFDKSISYSQRIKVKSFWKFVAETKPLEPCTIISEKKLATKKDRELPKCKRKWYNQLKVFQKYGLDKVALTTGEECKLCYEHSNYMSSEVCETIEESYDELLNDMKTFDERSHDNTNMN